MSKQSIEKYKNRLRKISKLSFLLSCVFGMTSGFIVSTSFLAGRSGHVYAAIVCGCLFLVNVGTYIAASKSLSREEKELCAFLSKGDER